MSHLCNKAGLWHPPRLLCPTTWSNFLIGQCTIKSQHCHCHQAPSARHKSMSDFSWTVFFLFDRKVITVYIVSLAGPGKVDSTPEHQSRTAANFTTHVCTYQHIHFKLIGTFSYFFFYPYWTTAKLPWPLKVQEARKVDDVKPKEVNDHEPHSLLPQKHNEDKSKFCKTLSMTSVHNTSQALQEVHGASPIQVQIYISTFQMNHLFMLLDWYRVFLLLIHVQKRQTSRLLRRDRVRRSTRKHLS